MRKLIVFIALTLFWWFDRRQTASMRFSSVAVIFHFYFGVRYWIEYWLTFQLEAGAHKAKCSCGFLLPCAFSCGASKQCHLWRVQCKSRLKLITFPCEYRSSEPQAHALAHHTKHKVDRMRRPQQTNLPKGKKKNDLCIEAWPDVRFGGIGFEKSVFLCLCVQLCPCLCLSLCPFALILFIYFCYRYVRVDFCFDSRSNYRSFTWLARHSVALDIARASHHTIRLELPLYKCIWLDQGEWTLLIIFTCLFCVTENDRKYEFGPTDSRSGQIIGDLNAHGKRCYHFLVLPSNE